MADTLFAARIAAQPVVVSGTFTANGTLSIPAGYQIVAASVVNTTGNAVTGGIRVGKTAAATDVIIALATGANAVIGIPNATLLLTYFSTTVAQDLFVEAVVAWNSASVNVALYCVKMN